MYLKKNVTNAKKLGTVPKFGKMPNKLEKI